MNHDEHEHEPPWNEEQWEKFFKESDVRSAKFGELLETLKDHPDRDAIIEHEMGWDRDDDGPDFEWDEDTLEDDVDDEEAEHPFGRDVDDDTDDEDDEDLDWDERDLKQKPYYASAYRFGLKVHDVLKPYTLPDEDDQDEDLIDAIAHGFTIAAKLAGANGMGEEDDVICGNIVCCKRSLEAANDCLRALNALRQRGLVPREVADLLVKDGEEMRMLVEQHIADLRSRVWWQ
jgi:hypothetical protein